MGDDDDDEMPALFARLAARAAATRARSSSGSPSSSAPAPVAAGMEAALRSLVDDGGLALTDADAVHSLAGRLLTHLETLDTPHIGRAISEWLLEQDEVDELYADDATIVETIRRNMPAR